MARQNLIDWQRDCLLVAIGQGQGATRTIERVSVQHIGALPTDEPGTLPRNGDAAQGLKRAVEELGLRKAEVTVIVARELVEVRTLAIPRMDSADLPDVIRFQAQRQLASMGEQWTLDYVLLPEEPGQEMLTALVGAVPPAVLREIETACSEAGVQLTHVALRPIEIARFATSAGHVSSQDAAAVICLSEHEADLLILNRGSVVQVRSTRLPSDPAQLSTALNGELRRSLMAAAAPLGGKPIKNTLLLASPAAASAVESLVHQVLDCPLVVVDPAQMLSASLPQRQELALSAANRVAGLCGALSFAAAGQQDKLDFKDPKKRPPPKSKRSTYILAAAAAAVLALGGVYWWTSENQALDEELAMYRDKVTSQQELTKAAEARIAQLKEVETFLNASPNWLDELVYLSEKIPGAEQVIVGDTSFAVQADGTGRMSLPVAADTSPSLSAFEKSLRDDAHVVTGKNQLQLDETLLGRYRWKVDATIAVKGRGWNLIDQLETGRAGATKQVSTAATAAPAEVNTAEISAAEASSAQVNTAQVNPAQNN